MAIQERAGAVGPVTIKQLIGSDWEAGQGEAALDLTSPIDGSALGTITQASSDQVKKAVAAAHAAGAQWSRRSPKERAEVIEACAEEVLRRKPEIARAMTLEQGKPYEGQALPEVDEVLATMYQCAGDITRLESPMLPSPDPNKRILTVRAPLGVVAVISPWNYPTLPLMQGAPTIAAGNTVVCKPAEVTPWTAQLLAEALLDAGLPEGVFNVIQGGGEVGNALVTDPGVAAIYFVGSSDTAERIVKAAGLKRTLIEASGNGPVIFFADGDYARAAEALTMASMYNAGQVCTATGRVLVERSAHDQLLEAVVEQAKEWQLGDPFEAGTAVGPMAHLPTADRVRSQFAEATDLGADVAYQASMPESAAGNQHFVQPTVLGNVPSAARVHHEETFGPVIPLVPFDDDDEALQLAAMSEMGLQGAVFTSDLRRAFRFAEALRIGATVVNDGTLGSLVPIPYGGAAGSRSGWGKIGGRFELEDLTDLRVIALDIS